jgi:Tripartite tricarboxylate transporter family receptor
MSRGPGWIERAIEAVLSAEADNTFTVEELCRRVYSGGGVARRPVSTPHAQRRAMGYRETGGGPITYAMNQAAGRRRPGIAPVAPPLRREGGLYRPGRVGGHPGLREFPDQTISELIRLAREKPEGLAFGSVGVGSGSHFSGELFNVMAGIKLVHVPYPGTAQAVTDLLGGRVQVVFPPASSALQFVDERKIIALASTGAKRSRVAPELPTVSESGLPGYDTSGWFGLLAPTGVPRGIIERLAAATREAVKSR